MASIRKRGEYQWCAQIEKINRATGLVHKEIQTFRTKKEAETWATGIETDLARGVYNDTRLASKTPLRKLIQRHIEEVSPRKLGSKQEIVRLKKWLTHELADRMLTLIYPEDFSTYISERRADGRAEQTIKSEIIAISNVFKIARADWGYKIENPIRYISKPKGSKKRTQRILQKYWVKIKAALKKCRNPNYVVITELAIETAMRQGELLSMAWDDINLRGRYIVVRGKDTTGEQEEGKERIVPLSMRAVELLKSLPQHEDKSIPVFQAKQKTSSDGLSRAFKSACKVSGLPTARFHDTRHEAASRMAPHFEMQELMKIGGWDTPSQVARYYNPTAKELTKKMDEMQKSLKRK